MLKYVYSLFIFVFLAFSQADVLGYLISYAIGRPTTTYPILSALLLTIIVFMLIFWGEKKLLKHAKDKFIVYIFTAWLLTSLTSLCFVSWCYQLLLALAAIVLCVLVIYLKNKIKAHSSTVLWKNAQLLLLQLSALFLYIGMGNGVTDIQHYELRTAQSLISNQPEKGYHVGENSYATSQRLFSMRCFLLSKSKKDGLANELFKQVVPTSGVNSLFFPTDNKQQLLIPIDSLYQLLGSPPYHNETTMSYLRRCAWLATIKNKTNKEAVINYYLCGLLLERDLKTFATELKRFYPERIESGKLPTYFSQALILCKRSSTQQHINYNDATIEANYHDYTDMGDTIANKTERSNLLRHSYGDTYWWWYVYGVR